MTFDPPLIKGTLIRRYKRFLADVQLENGEMVVAHCTNSGSMKTCIEEGAPVFLTPANDPKRKTKFTWELIYINNGWIGINTSVPNKLAYEWIKSGKITKLSGYSKVQLEVKFGDSRFDVYAESQKEKCFIEVKNVTMKVGTVAKFPDAVTSRGLKHLETLLKVKQSGMRAVMLYVIQRMDVEAFGPAKDIDPNYATTLAKVHRQGVEIIAVQVKVTPEKIEYWRELPFVL